MSVYVRPGVGKGIPVPIPGLEKVSPNPKNFQIHSQSFQNSIPIPKFEPDPIQSQKIFGIPIPKIPLRKTSKIEKKRDKSSWAHKNAE